VTFTYWAVAALAVTTTAAAAVLAVRCSCKAFGFLSVRFLSLSVAAVPQTRHKPSRAVAAVTQQLTFTGP
jgi:hypothetical protein